MTLDIVFPDNNEHEFIELAHKLGYARMVFAYEYPKVPKQKPEHDKIAVQLAVLAHPRQVAKAKKLSDFVMVKGNDRQVIEKAKPQLILELESQPKKDPMHARNSGLNHVLCELLHKNNIAVGLSLHLLLHSEHRSMLLGRMLQNIRLCKKYKVKLVLASFAINPYEMRSAHDMAALERCLGMQ
jgi:RNase P/RNase MRP subunit p30